MIVGFLRKFGWVYRVFEWHLGVIVFGLMRRHYVKYMPYKITHYHLMCFCGGWSVGVVVGIAICCLWYLGCAVHLVDV